VDSEKIRLADNERRHHEHEAYFSHLYTKLDSHEKFEMIKLNEARAREDEVSWKHHLGHRHEYHKDISIHLEQREERVRADSMDSTKSDISHDSYDEHTGCKRVARIHAKL
jgi:hypothetical protein